MGAPSATSETSRDARDPAPGLVRGLSLLDSVLLLAGGIIGSSLFLTAKDIAGPVPHPGWLCRGGVLGALISMCAAFAFAELGSMFPDSGGQYVYLREAFGDLVAFLYGWMLFAVANGGTIAALSVASAAYLSAIFPAISQQHVIFSLPGLTFTRVHVVALLLNGLVTWINVVGLRRGAVLQNIATWAKFAAMGAFVVLGCALGHGSWSNFTASAGSGGISMGRTPAQLLSSVGVGLIAVFWAYDGWVYITWVAGEVKAPQKTIPRALMLGIIIVAMLYISMNVVYVYAMPYPQIRNYETIAHASAVRLFSPNAAVWLSLAIAISCFGAAAS